MEIEPSSPDELPPLEPTPPRRGRQLHILRQIIFQPRQAFSEIVSQEKRATWLTPIILVAALVVIAALVSAQDTSSPSLASLNRSARSTQASTQGAQTTSTPRSSRSGQTQSNQGGGAFPGGPVDFPGGPPEGFVISGDVAGPFVGGNNTTSGSTSQSGASGTTGTRNVWLPVLMPVASFILTWLILGGLTNLLSLAFGGHSNALMAINIAAWASIPVGVRNIMQIIYYLATGNAIQMPGLSGFAPTAAGNNLLIFLQHLLSRVDIYLFWQMALVGIGVSIWGGLSRKKSIPIAILAVGIIILLQSLLGLGLELLGNVNINTNLLYRLR